MAFIDGALPSTVPSMSRNRQLARSQQWLQRKYHWPWRIDRQAGYICKMGCLYEETPLTISHMYLGTQLGIIG